MNFWKPSGFVSVVWLLAACASMAERVPRAGLFGPGNQLAQEPCATYTVNKLLARGKAYEKDSGTAALRNDLTALVENVFLPAGDGCPVQVEITATYDAQGLKSFPLSLTYLGSGMPYNYSVRLQAEFYGGEPRARLHSITEDYAWRKNADPISGDDMAGVLNQAMFNLQSKIKKNRADLKAALQPGVAKATVQTAAHPVPVKADADEVRRLVFFDVTVDDVTSLAGKGKIFSKVLQNELVKLPGLKVIDQGARDTMLLQRKLKLEDCAKAECRFSMAKSLPGMDLMLEASIASLGEKCSTSITVKSMRSGTIENSVFEESACDVDSVLATLRKAARATWPPPRP